MPIADSAEIVGACLAASIWYRPAAPKLTSAYLQLVL